MSPGRRNPTAALLGSIVLVLAACAGSPAATTAPGLSPIDLVGTDAPPVPDLDPTLVARGEALYGMWCAVCHGQDLSGDPDWKIPNSDGSYPPPPHDSSGHTWHHSDQLLLSIIRDGQDSPDSRMPAFGDRLSDDEIMSILEFFKSRWGSEERRFQWVVTWQER